MNHYKQVKDDKLQTLEVYKQMRNNESSKQQKDESRKQKDIKRQYNEDENEQSSPQFQLLVMQNDQINNALSIEGDLQIQRDQSKQQKGYQNEQGRIKKGYQNEQVSIKKGYQNQNEQGRIKREMELQQQVSIKLNLLYGQLWSEQSKQTVSMVRDCKKNRMGVHFVSHQQQISQLQQLKNISKQKGDVQYNQIQFMVSMKRAFHQHNVDNDQQQQQKIEDNFEHLSIMQNQYLPMMETEQTMNNNNNNETLQTTPNIQQSNTTLVSQSNPSTTTTRLQIEKHKHNLQFIHLHNQLFIYLTTQGQIITSQNIQLTGLLLMTNCRLILFKQTNINHKSILKQINNKNITSSSTYQNIINTKQLPYNSPKQNIPLITLPFGILKTLQYNHKKKQIHLITYFDYTYKISSTEIDYNKLTMMLGIYAKPQHLKSIFAFQHALNYYEHNKTKRPSQFDILKEYLRLKFTDYTQVITNTEFTLSDTYPPYILIPLGVKKQHIKSICQNFTNNRLPVMTYKYGQGQNWTGLWIGGGLKEDKKVNEKQVADYYQLVCCKQYHQNNNNKNSNSNNVSNNNNKLYVYYFNTSNSNNNKPQSSKFINQQSFSNNNFHISIHSINTLPTNQQTRTSYISLVQAYITSTSFFSQVIQSKWLQTVLHYVSIAFDISERIMMGKAVVLKQDQPIQKSLIISALIQLILQPYYRTIKGIRSLIMKQFISFGYEFASRIGSRDTNQQCPLFIVFLDSVSQLIHLNPLCFQFNQQYLAKIAKQMYTNLYGTFLCDSPKQFFLQQIQQKTLQIWTDIDTQLTRNPFYQIKNGLLTNKPKSINDLKLWTEHFAYLTTQPKDAYKIYASAESTNDNISLQCLKIKQQNIQIKLQLDKQKLQINNLKQLIALNLNKRKIIK